MNSRPVVIPRTSCPLVNSETYCAVCGTEALGDQKFNRLPDQLAIGVAEHPFGLRIGERDHTRFIDDHYAVRRRLDDDSALRLLNLLVGEVARHFDKAAQ